MSKSWLKIPFKTFKSSPLRQHCILIWPDGAQGKSVWDYRWTPVIQGLTLRFLKRDFHNIWLQAGFEKILIYCDSNGGNYSLPGTIACSSPAPTPFLSLSWGFAIQGWPGEKAVTMMMRTMMPSWWGSNKKQGLALESVIMGPVMVSVKTLVMRSSMRLGLGD